MNANELCRLVKENTGKETWDLMEVLLPAMDTYGEEAVTEKVTYLIDSGKLRNVNSPSRYIRTCLRNLTPSPSPSKREPAPVETVAEPKREEAEEMSDDEYLAEWKALNEELGFTAEFTEPNDPRLFKRPSILETSPYTGREADYAENTLIEVYRKAKEAGVSMKEICRRLDLRFDLLIA